MAWVDVLLSPIVVFIASLLVAAIIYGIGQRISPKVEESEGKLSTYACGEDMKVERSPLSANLYNYAAMFLVMDVVAIMIVLSMGNSTFNQPIVAILSAIYIILMLIAVLLILPRR